MVKTSKYTQKLKVGRGKGEVKAVKRPTSWFWVVKTSILKTSKYTQKPKVGQSLLKYMCV